MVVKEQSETKAKSGRKISRFLILHYGYIVVIILSLTVEMTKKPLTQVNSMGCGFSIFLVKCVRVFFCYRPFDLRIIPAMDLGVISS